MFLPANTKLVTEQAAGGSDIVCYMIENYINIFSTEYEYCLGEETDIQLDDIREEGNADDSDSGADHVLDKYGDAEDDVEVDDRDEEGAEPLTPDFMLSPVDGVGVDTVFTHSDSSLNTNDSDELKMLMLNNKLNLPHHQNVLPSASAGISSGSKSSPNSPMMLRRKKIEKSLSNDNKLNSDWSDQEADNENFQRRLLRQPRQKRMLSSTTTSAELIEHKRHMTDSSSTSIASGEGGISPNSSSHSIPTTSSATLVPQRHVISQPVIHHFATEYRPTPNVIFHAVDRRRQPAAPSYEEHIQRTQSKSRVVATAATARQPVVAHTSIVQHQSSITTKTRDERPNELNLSPKSSISESNSQHSISSTSSNEDRRGATVSRQPRVNKYEKPKMVSPKHSTTNMSIEEHFFGTPTTPTLETPQQQQTQQENSLDTVQKPNKLKKKITQEESTMIQELLNNLRDGYETPVNDENKTMEQILLARSISSEMENNVSELNKDTTDEGETTCNEGVKTIEDTFNSIMDSLQHNVDLNGQSCRMSPERTKNNSPPPTAPKPPKTNSSSTTKTLSTTKDVEATPVEVTPTPCDDIVRAPSPTQTTVMHITETTTKTTTTTIATNDEMESLNTLLSSLAESDSIDGMSPTKRSSPFTLNLKTTANFPSSMTDNNTGVSTTKKLSPQSPLESEGDESYQHKMSPKMSPNTSSSSLALEKTLLTKAPKKIDQLTLKLSTGDGRRDDQTTGSNRATTAREMRRTNRRLKSEIRNAFNEGKFNLNNNKKDFGRSIVATSTTATGGGSIHKTININNFFNGQIKRDASGNAGGDRDVNSGVVVGHRQKNKENILANLFQDKVSRQCYTTENNNITATADNNFVGETEDLLTIEKGDSDAAFARIMSQAESYV